MEVVRHDIINTTLDQLMEATERDWASNLLVRFIGEAGVDAGGPRRELFTLFFGSTSLFDRHLFKASSDFLHQGLYKLLGKTVAYAIISGHPGPRRLNHTVAAYIINQCDDLPATVVNDMEVQDAGVLHILSQVCFVDD